MCACGLVADVADPLRARWRRGCLGRPDLRPADERCQQLFEAPEQPLPRRPGLSFRTVVSLRHSISF